MNTYSSARFGRLNDVRSGNGLGRNKRTDVYYRTNTGQPVQQAIKAHFGCVCVSRIYITFDGLMKRKFVADSTWATAASDKFSYTPDFANNMHENGRSIVCKRLIDNKRRRRTIIGH